MRGILDGRKIAAPLAILAFWCGMGAAAHAYPAGYDWRYQTLSVLLYADENPHGFLWAWAGLWLCGVAGFAWTAEAGRCSGGASTNSAASGLRWLQWGFLFMCCAVLPDRLLPWSKGHELFAILAFLGIAIGVMRQMWLLAEARAANPASGTFTVRKVFRPILPVLPLIPLLIAGATQMYLAFSRPDLPWVTPLWRTRGISPFLSFGLWEWVSCALFSVCLLTLWVDRLVSADRR